MNNDHFNRLPYVSLVYIRCKQAGFLPFIFCWPVEKGGEKTGNLLYPEPFITGCIYLLDVDGRGWSIYSSWSWGGKEGGGELKLGYWRLTGGDLFGPEDQWCMDGEEDVRFSGKKIWKKKKSARELNVFHVSFGNIILKRTRNMEGGRSTSPRMQD